MNEFLSERSLRIPVNSTNSDIIGEVESQVLKQMMPGESPVRFAVTESEGEIWNCDVGVQVGGEHPESIFRINKRVGEDNSSFNAVMLVPTGIGAEIGGHAGDAAPAATLLAAACDTLITHPNVLNASDLIQVTPNTLYVEGSVITRLIMGSIRLQPTRANRLLVLLHEHEDELFTNAAINSVNAARAYYGLSVAEVVMIDSRFNMSTEYTPSGVASGRIEGLNHIWEILDSRRGNFDAVAISSIISAPLEFHRDYYEHRGSMVNPWGGVEAMLTHAISLKYNLPSAHSPMFDSRDIAELDLGVVDPRMAAEVVSVTFLQCILRGLQQSPRIIDSDKIGARGEVGAESISCLVIPDGCLGLPTLAALHQGIPVVAVSENKNIMRNDLTSLPWSEGQLILVDNYWEAAGVLLTLKEGLDPLSVRRPLSGASIRRSKSKVALSENGA